MPSQTTLTLLHKEAKKRVFLQGTLELKEKGLGYTISLCHALFEKTPFYYIGKTVCQNRNGPHCNRLLLTSGQFRGRTYVKRDHRRRNCVKEGHFSEACRTYAGANRAQEGSI